MSSTVQVTVHTSQFPGNVRRELLECLRTRSIHPRFHYDSLKQTHKWLEVHQAYSPSRHDPDCAAIYDRAFENAALACGSRLVHLIGLGCGGGQKDTRFLRLLRPGRSALRYSPCDVSVAMTLVAYDTVVSTLPDIDVRPFVCDLATATDLPDRFRELDPPGTMRVITFFGMIPNFEPELILPRLGDLIRPGDLLLFSANLTPDDAGPGIQRILPQYDNPLTRDWLMQFLFDLGIESGDGELRFGIEQHDSIPQLQRITATFTFHRTRAIKVDDEAITFSPDDTLRLFYSYRYTPELAGTLLRQHGMDIRDEFITRSREEAVFVCGRAQVTPQS